VGEVWNGPSRGTETDGDGQNVFAAEAVREDTGPTFFDSQQRVTEALKRGAWHTRNDLSEGGLRHRSRTRYMVAQLPAEATIGGAARAALDAARGAL